MIPQQVNVDRPPDRSRLENAFLHLDELMSEVGDLSPHDVGRWSLAVDARLAAVRRAARREPDAGVEEEIRRYEFRADEAITKIAERDAALARLRLYAAESDPLPHSTAPGGALEIQTLRARLDGLLSDYAAGRVPRSGPVKGEWVNAATSAAAAARRIAKRTRDPELVVEFGGYSARVRESIVALRGRARQAPQPPQTAAPSRLSDASSRRLADQADQDTTSDGGDWRIVRGVWHRIREGTAMYCGVIAGGEGRRRSRNANYCRECAERGEADDAFKAQGRRAPQRAQNARIWVVSGGAPGLGRR